MIVTVTQVSSPASPLDSILTASGLDTKGRTITFGGDTRVMRDVAALVEEYGELDCDVETWQILSIVHPEPEPDPAPVDPQGQPSLFEVIGVTEVDTRG